MNKTLYLSESKAIHPAKDETQYLFLCADVDVDLSDMSFTTEKVYHSKEVYTTIHSMKCGRPIEKSIEQVLKREEYPINMSCFSAESQAFIGKLIEESVESITEEEINEWVADAKMQSQL